MPNSIRSNRARPNGLTDPSEAVGIVLAAGLGERLRPLTDAWPKPALPFLNRPLMTYGLELLASAGIRRIGINVFHHPQRVIETVRDWLSERDESSFDVVISHERALMGTGGGARGVWEAMGRPAGPVVILNGDIVADFDLREHIEQHLRGRREEIAASLIVTREGEGRVVVEEGSNRIVQLPGPSGPVRTQSGGVEVSFVGASILEAEAMQELSVEPGCLIRHGLAGSPLVENQLRASFSSGYHLDVGTPSRYWAATKAALDKIGRSVSINLPEGCTVRPPVSIDETTIIEGVVDLGPYTVLGGATRVAAGTRASRCVAYATRLEGELVERFRVEGLELLLT